MSTKNVRNLTLELPAPLKKKNHLACKDENKSVRNSSYFDLSLIANYSRIRSSDQPEAKYKDVFLLKETQWLSTRFELPPNKRSFVDTSLTRYPLVQVTPRLWGYRLV